MTKKRILLAFGILLFSVVLAQTAMAQTAACTNYVHQLSSADGEGVMTTVFCPNPGEYAVRFPTSHCRHDALYAPEAFYGNYLDGVCDRYVSCDGTPPCTKHTQVVTLEYACCKYDEPAESPAADQCDFLIEGIDNCPDVVPNQTNIDNGWVFPMTYTYKALDCHPEDDSATEKYPQEESAGDDVSASTASGAGVCSTNFDEDCDGIINEPSSCEADANRTICETSCTIGGGACQWKTSDSFRSQACCGDDIGYNGGDCGRIVSNTICSDDGWLSPSTNENGLIHPDGCGGEILLDSANIYRCQPEAKPRTFNLKLEKKPGLRNTEISPLILQILQVSSVKSYGLLSRFTSLDADEYAIASSNPNVKVTFADSLSDATSKFNTNQLTTTAQTDKTIFAFYPSPGQAEFSIITKKIIKNDFYPILTFKQFEAYEGLNALGQLSQHTLLDTWEYTLTSDDPEVKLTFADSDAAALSKFVNNQLTATFVSDQLAATALTDTKIYAYFTPNTQTSFGKATITKDNTAHDYICYEKNPATNDETRKIAECNGDRDNPDFQNTAFSSYFVYTGIKADPSLIFNDSFTDQSTLAKTGNQYQYKLNWLNGLTETDNDAAVNISHINSRLIYDATGNINPLEGTIEFWIKPKWTLANNPTEKVLFNYQEIDSSYLRISKPAESEKIVCMLKDLSSQLKSELDVNLTADNWYKIIMSWDSTTLVCSIEDINNNILARQTSSGTVRPLRSSTFSLGMMPGNANAVANAVFDDLKIYKTIKPIAYYCTDDFKWEPDLDSANYATACQLSEDLKWTGTHCCGEIIDTPEYYNDNGQELAYKGGCWASKWNDWGELPKIGTSTGDMGPVINYKGNYESCNATNDIITIKDVFTNQQLVHDNTQCTLLADARGNDKDFYCSVDGNWKFATNDYLDTLGQTTNESRILKNYPWQDDASTASQECCAINDCWNGYECIRNQRYDASYRTYNNYRCLDGSWTTQTPKITWDRKDKGFCPEQSQCLVNPGGSEANNNDPQTYFTTTIQEQPQCIQNSQYIKQYYCENGNWSTRTKLIALQLIEMAAPTGDYELLCGDFNDVLTYVGYEAISGAGAVQNYMRTCSIAGTSVACVNQFCAVKYRDGVAFGTSLNIDVDDSSKSFTRYAMGKTITFCDTAKNNDDDYDLCGENIYYNHNTNSIIKMPTGSLPQATTAQLLANRNFEIQNRFNAIKNYAQTSSLVSASGNTFVNTTTLFENIFLAKKGNKDFFAYLEEKQFMERPNNALVRVDSIGGHYSNLIILDNPCGINHIGQKTGAETHSCSYANNNLNFVGIYSSASQDTPTIKQLWRGLTGMLRIS